jgi:hypothetical protein
VTTLDSATPREVYQSVLDRFTDFGRRVRGRLVFEGVVRLFAAAVGLALLSFLFDRTFHLSVVARWALLAVSAIVIGVVFWKAVIAPLRLILDPLTLAVAVDRHAGGNGLLTARVASVLELPEKLDHPGGASVALLRAAAADCHRVLSAVDLPTRLNDRRQSIAISAAVVVVLVPFFLAIGSPATTSLWARRVFAGSTEPWPQKTYLSVAGLTGRTIVVPRGEPYTLRVSARDGSVVPEVVAVRFKPEGGSKVEANMVSFGRNDFRFEFPSVETPTDVTVTGGDDTTEPFTIRPADRPRVVELQLTSRHPTATADSVYNVLSADSDLSFLAMTRLSLQFKANTPIATATIKASVPGPVQADVVRLDDRTFSVSWAQAKAVQLEIDLVSVDAGLASVPTQVGIGLKVDQPPRVTIAFSDVKSRVTGRANIPFKIGADDDYGVASVTFVVKTEVPDPTNPAVLKANTTETVLFGPAKPAAEKHVQLKQLLSLAPLSLPPGSLVTVTAVATDDCYLGAQKTPSRPVTFRVVTDEDLYKEILARQQAERSRFQKQSIESQAIRVAMNDLTTPPAITAVAARHRTVDHEVAHVRMILTELLAEMRANQLGTADTYNTMQSSVLTPIGNLEADLIRPQAAAIEELKPADTAAVEAVRTRQDQIVLRMADVLRQMNQWDSLVSVLNQLDEVIKVQTKAKDETMELKKKEAEDIFNK